MSESQIVERPNCRVLDRAEELAQQLDDLPEVIAGPDDDFLEGITGTVACLADHCGTPCTNHCTAVCRDIWIRSPRAGEGA